MQDKDETFTSLDSSFSYVKSTEIAKKKNSNIRVVVRVRPLLIRELEIDPASIIKIQDSSLVTLHDPFSELQPEEVFRINRQKDSTYAFDRVFDQITDQFEVFEHSTKYLLGDVLEGYNATVFAYGATGHGKTYTMLGTVEKPGVMYLTVRELFTQISARTQENWCCNLSYLEIYNENIRDLLNVSQDYLDLREDPYKGVTIHGLSKLNVTSVEEVMQILHQGNKSRTTEATNANETSSRSHAVLQVKIEQGDALVQQEISIGKLNLIDLAGSERASNTMNRGLRLIEGANINRSLLALGNCINALANQSEKQKHNHIPYRDSKLTRILKDSLGGNCRTSMIANISSFSSHLEDIRNTLKYANRAKNIKISLHKNILNVKQDLKDYLNVIRQLREEVQHLKLQMEVPLPEKSNQFDRVFQELRSHSNEEMQIKQKILNLELQINQFEIDKYRSKLNDQEYLASNKESLKELKMQKSQLMNIFREKVRKRELLQTQWTKCNLYEFEIKSLQQTLQEQMQQVENIELKIWQNQKQHQMNLKQIYIEKLEQQLKVRDNAIQLQKQLGNEFLVEVQNKDARNINKKIQTLPQIQLLQQPNQRLNASTETKVNLPPLSTQNTKTYIRQKRKSHNEDRNISGTSLSSISTKDTEMNEKKYQNQQRILRQSQLNDSFKRGNYIARKYEASPYVKNLLKSKF